MEHPPISFNTEGTTEYLSKSLTDLHTIYLKKHISAATLVETMRKIEGYRTAHYGGTYMQTPDGYAWFCVVQYLKEETTISVFFPWTNVDTQFEKPNPPVKIYFSSEPPKINLDSIITEMTNRIRDA